MRLDIYVHFDGLSGLFGSLATIITNQEKIMTSVADLNTKIDEMAKATDTERQEVLAALQANKDEIKRLSDLVAAGGTVPQADLDALGVRLDEQITKVQGVITDADK